MLEIAVFSAKNLTINNSVNLQNFLTKFGMLIAKLFRIIFCKFNRLRLSYFIMKRVGLQFFSDALFIYFLFLFIFIYFYFLFFYFFLIFSFTF